MTLTQREELAIYAADAIQEYHDVAPSAQQTASQWAEVFRRIGFFRCTQVFGTLNSQSRMLRLVSFADTRHHFADAWDRYLPAPADPETGNPGNPGNAGNAGVESESASWDDPGVCSHGVTVGARCSKCGGVAA